MTQVIKSGRDFKELGKNKINVFFGHPQQLLRIRIFSGEKRAFTV